VGFDERVTETPFSIRALLDQPKAIPWRSLLRVTFLHNSRSGVLCGSVRMDK
jgi:hypothetical protein